MYSTIDSSPVRSSIFSNNRHSNMTKISNFLSPRKKKRIVITTPESMSSSSFLSSPASSFDSFGKSGIKSQNRLSRFNFRGLTCIFCDELLNSILKDEDPPILLTCQHKCHPECFLMVLDRNDLSHLPICKICNIEAGCEDEIVEENMTRRLLLEQDEDMFSFEEHGMDYSTPITITKQSVSTPYLLAPKTPEDQIIEQNLSSAVTLLNNDYLKHIASPKVSFAPEVPKLNLSLPSQQDFFHLKCFLNIEGPSYHESPTPNKELTSKLITEMMHKLNEEVEEWKGIDLADLGELICFDFLEVGVNDEESSKARCFLFEKILLVMNTKGTEIDGTVLIKDITSCIETDDSVIQLNLKTESLPVVYLNCNSNKIIVKKWYHLITKSAALLEDEEFLFDDNQLIQLSTNAWDLITINKSMIPFTKPSLKIYEMTIPKPNPLPVSLILCVSLINNTKFSNDEYLQNVQQLIRTYLKSLSSKDSFGLVTIGKSPVTGEFSQDGCYTGTASPEWVEWEEVIQDLKISDKQVFEDEYDLLNEILLQSTKIVSSNFEFKQSKRIKKVVCVTCLQELQEVDSRWRESQLRQSVSILIQKYGVQLDSKLVGNYSKKYLYYLSNSLKIVTVENGYYQVTLGSQFQRYDDFSQLIDQTPDEIAKLEDISVPNFEITLTTESLNNIVISSIENLTTGEMVEFESQFDQLKINIYNLCINESRNLLVNLMINKLEFDQRNIFKEIDLATVQGNWFNMLEETELEISCIKLALSEQKFARLPDIEVEDDEFIELPLLPPLISSQREILYIKREIELIFVKNLILSIETGEIEYLFEKISLIWGILKSCDGNTLIKVGYATKRFKIYVEELCERGKQILQENDIKLGYDLCFQIGLQT